MQVTPTSTDTDAAVVTKQSNHKDEQSNDRYASHCRFQNDDELGKCVGGGELFSQNEIRRWLENNSVVGACVTEITVVTVSWSRLHQANKANHGTDWRRQTNICCWTDMVDQKVLSIE